MADRRQNPWFVLIKKALFRAAFAGFVLLQVVLLGLIAAGISTLFPSDKFFVQDIRLALTFVALLLIGAGSYLVFQRMTRVDYVVAASERWLAERRQTNRRWIKWRRKLKRWAVWIPALSVVLACTFLDQTRAVASHLFQPRAGRIIGYRVSIPMSWTVWFGQPYLRADQTWSFVTSMKSTGTLPAVRDYYLGRAPHFHMSEMAFYGAKGEQLKTNRHSPFGYDRTISSWESTFAGGLLTCSEYFSNYKREIGSREIACWTPNGDFSCFFSGYEPDVDEFYQTLQATRAVR